MGRHVSVGPANSAKTPQLPILIWWFLDVVFKIFVGPTRQWSSHFVKKLSKNFGMLMLIIFFLRCPFLESQDSILCFPPLRIRFVFADGLFVVLGFYGSFGLFFCLRRNRWICGSDLWWFMFFLKFWFVGSARAFPRFSKWALVRPHYRVQF